MAFLPTTSEIRAACEAVQKSAIAAADKAMRGMEAVADQTERAVNAAAQATARAAVRTYDAVRDGTEKAAVATTNAAVAAYDRAEKAVDAAAQATARAAVRTYDAVRDGAEKAAIATTNAAVAAYEKSKKVFTAAKAAVVTVACRVANAGAQGLGFGVAAILGLAANILSGPVLEPLIRRLVPPPTSGAESKDGQRTDAELCCVMPGSGGIRPPGCFRKLPKAHYVNGINTEIEAHCATLIKLAQATCKEFTGIYNKTYGILSDVVESVDNIQRNTNMSGDILADDIMDSLTKEPPIPMEIYAHSQGGLITQNAIIDVKTQLEAEYSNKNFSGRKPTSAEKRERDNYVNRRMSNLTVYAFGTAIAGWPDGPKYQGSVNLSDPVPQIIAGAQRNNMNHVVGNRVIPTHVFNSPKVLFDAHSMDEIYIPEMVARSPPACKCGLRRS